MGGKVGEKSEEMGHAEDLCRAGWARCGQLNGSLEPGEDCGIMETGRSGPHSSLLRVLRAPFPRAGMQIQTLKQPGEEQATTAGKQGPWTQLRLAVPVGAQQQQRSQAATLICRLAARCSCCRAKSMCMGWWQSLLRLQRPLQEVAAHL